MNHHGALAALTFVAVAAAYLMGAEVGHWLSAEPGHFSTFWPNSGLYLAVLLRTPTRRWWAVVAGAVTANLTSDLLHGQRPGVALGFALANTAEALTGAVVVGRWVGGPVRLDNLRDVLRLFATAALVAAPLGGLVGAATVATAFGTPLRATWPVWWVADALGVLLAAPLVLAVLDMRAWPRPARVLEGGALVGGLVAAGMFVFTANPPTAPAVLLLFLLWAAVRLEIPGVAVAAVVLAAVAVRHTIQGHGLFAVSPDPLARVLAVQVFVSVAALVFYAFAVVLHERRLAAATLEERVRERTTELLAQRELLHVTLSSIGDAVITTDTAGRVTGMNPVAEGLTGWSSAGARGQPLEAVFRIVNEATRQAVVSPAQRALAEGAVVGLSNHTLLIRRDGSELPIDDSAAPIRDRGGQVVGCVLVFRDISDRHRAEAERREAEREVVTTLASISDGFMRFDRDWKIRYANDEALRLIRRTRAELIGRDVWAAFPGVLGTRVESEYRRAVAERTAVELEHYYEPLGGWFVVRGYPTPDGGLAVYFLDVTARKRADESRQRSEERFRRAADAVNGIIYEYEFSTGRVERTRGLYEVVGFRPDEVPATADWWAGRMHPDDRERLAGVDPSTVQSGRTVTEYRVQHKDGRWLHVEDRAVLVRGADGRPVRLVGCTVDVTERKRSEEAEARSRRLFEQIAATTPDLVYIFDRVENRNVYINPAIGRILGISQEQIAALGPDLIGTLVHPDDLAAALEESTRIALLADGEVHEHEVRMRHAAGGYRWLRCREVVFERGDDGRATRVIGTAQDVTEQKAHQEALAASEGRFRQLADAVPQLVWVADPDGRVSYFNRRWYEYTGADPGATLGHGWTAFLHPDDRDRCLATWRRAVEGGGVYEAEVRNRRADGEYRWFLARALPVRGAGGEIEAWFGTSTDVHDQRLIEQRLRESEAFARQVSEVAPSVLYVYDLDERRNVWGNREMFDGLGYSREQLDAMSGDLLGTLLHPDDYDRYTNHAARLATLPDGGVAEFEYRMRAADGSWRWLVGRDMVFRRAGGRVTQIIGSALDITARKQAEERLQASEERLRLAVEATGLGVWQADHEAGRIVWSERCRVIFGFPPDAELTRDMVLARVHPDDRDLLVRATEESFRPGAVFSIEHRVVLPGGEVRWVAAVGRSLPPGKPGDPRAELHTGVMFDVTERRRAEQAVRDSETHFRSIADNAPTMLWVTDPAGSCTYLSSRWYEFTGTIPEQGLGLGWLDSVHPDDRRHAEEVFLDASRRRVSFSLDYRLRRHDGPYRWAVDAGRPRFGPDGEFLGFVGTVTDIHDRRLAEEAVRASEGRYHALFESMDEGYCVIEVAFDDLGRAVDYRIEEANPAFERHTGQTGLMGRWVRATLPDLEEFWFETYGRVARTGEPTRFEHQSAALGGRWFDVSAFRLDGGGSNRVAVLFSDVSHRRRAEERSRLLSEAGAVLLSTDDPDAMLRGVFAKLAPALGLDAYLNFMADEGGGGLRLASCGGVPEGAVRSLEWLEFGQAVCGRVAGTRRPVHACHIQQSDDPMTALVRSLGLRAYACHPLQAGDQLLGTLSFGSRSRDTFADEELEFLRTISNYVSSAYERLRLLDRLRETDRRKDEFLATLAHELRNPLAPIRNGIQNLKLAARDPGAVERTRVMVERQVEQMAHLIDDLMDLSRISRGKIVLQKARMRLSDAVRDAVDTSRPLLDRQGHELELVVPDEPIYLDADHIRLTQVFANLLNNAAKYTDRGGRVRLAVEPRGAAVAVSVADTGVGIAADMLPRVFDMFAQVDHSLEKSQGGLGIGLNIVKRLVEMHGGTVGAESAGHGHGSTFTVVLPVVPPPPARAADPPADADAGAPTRRRILVVDDNEDGATSLAEMLELMGNDARTARDGLEAVAAVEAFRPDVVLMDLGMPRLNGFDACRRIREQPWGGGIVMVAQTGWGQDDDKRKSREAGFDFHMVKPVDPAELEKLLTKFRVPTA